MNPLLKNLLFSGALLLAACANQNQNQTSTEPPIPSVSVTTESRTGKPAVDKLGEQARKKDELSAVGAALSKSQERAAASPAAKRMVNLGEVSGIYPSTPAPVAAMPYLQQDREEREQYGTIVENPIKLVAEAPVSTFSIDVDTGSYSNVRRLLNEGRLPPADAVRVEEMINYFPYAYALPKDNAPFAVHTEMAPAPWNANHTLLRIGIKGQDIAKTSLPPSNLVFLVDVSGSMASPERLPLLKSALKFLVNQLRPQDRVSLVTYASGTQVVLEPTPGTQKTKIIAALDNLRAGGSTSGAAGIMLAYSMAEQSYIKGGINRIFLATDGDFNVGVTNFDELKNMAEEKRKSGVSLSTLGFGVGNYNEKLMEQLADAGNGNYSYIDTLNEGQKVLVDEMTSTLATIAKDVKVQIEFNPNVVSEYAARLKERVLALCLDSGLPEDRIALEVALLADKCDITEELVRLESHLRQFDETLTRTEPVGRKLDFLLQEINREVNTIGSKANDAEIAVCVVELKGELEKIREQVQNVE